MEKYRLEPPEPAAACSCRKCGQDIYVGESQECIDAGVCPDCIEDMVLHTLNLAQSTGDYSTLIEWLGL